MMNIKIDLSSKISKEFISTVSAMNSFYSKPLMRNALFTTVRNLLLKGLTTPNEVRSTITEFNTTCKENFKFVIFSPKHKIHNWVNEFEEARKKD